ncbi:MAG TPA: class I SAM-dependent methyltransferase [Elusimicrobiota bacterium]|jgi:O-methyltransferase involved in polyketide biosynthesis|nr:class I SAM-dependent methyltransferase [Elusimicrobiota bacterium]
MADLKLEPTAAMVMELGAGVFAESELGRRYMAGLDLSAAAELIDEHRRRGILELTRELMCNRKAAVRRELLRLVDQAGGAVQVLLLAAGKSPLGLETAVERPERVTAVFEADVSVPDDKRRLYASLAPGPAGKVRFVRADVTSPELPALLRAAGFDFGSPAVIALEGITHYISPEACRALLGVFASGEGRNAVIVEYGPPLAALADWVRPKARAAFSIIERRYFPQGMIKYDRAWFEAALRGLGGGLERHYPMEEMERLRTGANRFFSGPGSGWVEVLTGRL